MMLIFLDPSCIGILGDSENIESIQITQNNPLILTSHPIIAVECFSPYGLLYCGLVSMKNLVA